MIADGITDADIRAMNEAVDGRHRDPAEVVREFRIRKGLAAAPAALNERVDVLATVIVRIPKRWPTFEE